MIAKIFPSYTLDSFKKMIKKIGFKRYESEDNKTVFYSHHFFGKGDVEFLTSQVFDPNYEQNQLQMTFERNFVETLRRKRSDDPSLKKLIPLSVMAAPVLRRKLGQQRFLKNIPRGGFLRVRCILRKIVQNKFRPSDLQMIS